MSQNILNKQLVQLYYMSHLSYRKDNLSLSILIESIYKNGLIGHKQLLTFIINRHTNKNVVAYWIDRQIFELLLKSPFSIVTSSLKKRST